MRLIICSFIIGICLSSSIGCIKPYHEATLVDIGTSEIAILVETVNDNGQAIIAPPSAVTTNTDGTVDAFGQNQSSDAESIDFYSSRVVNARKIEIPYYWKQTARKWFYDSSTNGEWRPAARLIVVDQAPETREWHKDNNNGIWVESKDSVGFTTGISVTARIANKADAVKFLSNYPPEESRVVESQGGAPFQIEVASLEQVMDDELRTQIQTVYADECTGYNMDDLRSQKREILETVRKTVTPFFKERGITITAIGQFGGFTYENKDVQLAIDAVFEAQQDKEVAKAEAEAAEERKLALKLAGEGEGEKILQTKMKEAEGIKAIADAKAYELEQLQKNPEAYIMLKQLEVEMERLHEWDGKYPTYLFQTGVNGDSGTKMPQLLLTTPSPSK